MEESSSEYSIGSISNDELVKLVNSKSGTTRLFVANVAIERGPGAVLKLLNMINYGNEAVKNDIWIAVSHIKDKESINSVINFIECRKWKPHPPWWILTGFGDQGVELLIKELQQARDYDRSYIILALKDIDDPRADQALLGIYHNKHDPNWGAAVISLMKKKNEAVYSMVQNADNAEIIGRSISGANGYYGWNSFESIDDKRFLPLHFQLVKSYYNEYGRRGIARYAGKAELSRINKELKKSDREWVLPFVNINCALEGVKSPDQKADILWQYILDAKYYDQNMAYVKNPPYGGTEEFIRLFEYKSNKISDIEMLPVIYAIEKLAELGDVILPKIKEGMKSDKMEIKIRAIKALTGMPPSKASTKMMLKILDISSCDNISKGDSIFKGENILRGDIRDRVATKLADRNEKKAIPKLIQILHEMEKTPFFPSDILEALVSLSDKKVMPELIQIWQYMKDTPPIDDRYKETWDLSRTWFAGELAMIVNNWKVTDPELIPVFMDAMRSYSHTDFGGNYYHRIAAIHDLVRIGNPAIESIKLLLNSKDKFGRNDYMNKELAETALKILTLIP